MSRKLRRRLIIAGIAVALLIGLVLGVQRVLLFPGTARDADPNAGAEVAGLQRLYLQTEGGRVEAWLIPGKGVDAEHPGPLVIYAHGNGALIDHAPRVMVGYRERGISVLLPEYRGYGRSAGKPSEDGIAADFALFYDVVAKMPEVDAQRIVLHGRSLGGGVVAALARRRPSAAIVLQSTFTSVADLVWEKYFLPRLLVLDPFDSIELVSGYAGPILIVHGRDDTLIPVAHANALHEAAPDSELLLLNGGHNDTPASWPDLFVQIDAFLVKARVLPPR